MVKKKTSIETALPGFHREKQGKTVNYVSEDGKIRLSRRQAEYVRDGKKSLAEASLTSFRGKEIPFPYRKRTGNVYRFKSIFDVHDAIQSGVFDGKRYMHISARGHAKILYPGDNADLTQWRSPSGVSAHHTYTNPKFWDQVLDRIGEDFEGEPYEYDVYFLD
jgi:hypothetical protein